MAHGAGRAAQCPPERISSASQRAPSGEAVEVEVVVAAQVRVLRDAVQRARDVRRDAQLVLADQLVLLARHAAAEPERTRIISARERYSWPVQKAVAPRHQTQAEPGMSLLSGGSGLHMWAAVRSFRWSYIV